MPRDAYPVPYHPTFDSRNWICCFMLWEYNFSYGPVSGMWACNFLFYEILGGPDPGFWPSVLHKWSQFTLGLLPPITALNVAFHTPRALVRYGGITHKISDTLVWNGVELSKFYDTRLAPKFRKYPQAPYGGPSGFFTGTPLPLDCLGTGGKLTSIGLGVCDGWANFLNLPWTAGPLTFQPRIYQLATDRLVPIDRIEYGLRPTWTRRRAWGHTPIGAVPPWPFNA
jgi:hypothetical protein